MASDAIGLFVVTLQGAGTAISMAALIFVGPLASGLPRAVTSFVIAVGIASIVIGLRSRIVPVSVIIQDAPAIVMVAVAANLVAQQQSPRVSDVFVVLMITTLISGCAMWAFGQLRFGGLVRYLPTTVIGAFMAGTGWLLFKGGVDVIVGFNVGIADMTEFFGADLAKFWVPGLAMGISTWLVNRSDRLPPFAVGVTILGFVAVFYAVVSLFSSVAAVEDDNWLIGPFPEQEGVRLISASELADAGVQDLLGSASGILSVLGVSLVVLLLNITGIDTEQADRIDVDAELKASGLANILVSPLGPSPAFHALADTLLMNRLGVARRAVPVAAGALLVALGIVGVNAISYVPRIVVGALLITVGLSLLEGWIGDMRQSINLVEQVLSAGILFTIAAVGVLEGIGAGLLAACAVFIFRYSRVDPVRSSGSGRDIRSRVDRSTAQRDLLATKADDIQIFELQGFLFFGSLTTLEDQLNAVLSDPDRSIDATVIDFRNVTGVDVSGYALIGRVASDLHDRGTTVVFSTLDDRLHQAFLATTPALRDQVIVKPTLDEALEVVEEVYLGAVTTDEIETPRTLWLSSELVDEFSEVSFEADSIVMAQGDPSDGMLIVTEGNMTAFHVGRDGDRRRLRRFGPGTIVGEIGMIAGTPRTAEITAETPCTALRLSAESYHRLRAERPQLMFELQEFLMQEQSARVVELSEALARAQR